MSKPRTGYPSDVTDEQWAFFAAYLALVREDFPQRKHSLRDVFNAPVTFKIQLAGQDGVAVAGFAP